MSKTAHRQHGVCRRCPPVWDRGEVIPAAGETGSKCLNLSQFLMDAERDALRRGQRPQGDHAAELWLAGHRHQQRGEGGGVRGHLSVHGTQRAWHRHVQQHRGPPVK